MNLKQKREIVKRFKTGEPIFHIAFSMDNLNSLEVDAIIRDFMNGKFSLDKTERRKPEFCPNCSKYGLRPYIDPDTGGYTRCSLCKWTSIDGDKDG